MLRSASKAVLVGFISAVGVNIVLGQLENFTGYAGQGATRVGRAVDTIIHVGQGDLATIHRRQPPSA